MEKAFTGIKRRAQRWLDDHKISSERKKPLKKVKAKIDKAVKFLLTCDDLTSYEAYENSWTLVGASCECDRDELGLYLIKTGYVAFSPRLFQELQFSFKEKELKSQGFENLHYLLMCFWMCSDCREVCDELVKHDAIRLLFEALESTDHTIYEYKFINAMIVNILHNIILFNKSHRNIYRSCNGVGILKRFLDTTDMTQKTHVLSVLCYIVEEQDNKDLGDKGVLGFLVSLFKSAIEGPDHCAHDGTTVSAKDLIDVLNHLAVNDDNKMIIEKEGAVPLMIQMLDKSFTDEEKQLAAEGLWGLSFVESIKEKILQCGVVKALKPLVKSNNKDLRLACVSALWQIEPKPASSDSDKLVQPPSYSEAISQGASSDSSQAKSSQIMISYQWDSQKRAKDVRKRMTDAGYQVWMDLTNMRGDILQAMAGGVESSDVVLICITEQYKDSRSCRSEASYAYQRGKTIIPLLFEAGYKPDGWLGLLMGMDLYYEVHSDDAMKNNLSKLCEDIDKRFGISKEKGADDIVIKKEDKTTASKPCDEIDSPKPTSSGIVKASGWSNEDVQKWLNSNGLSHLCELDFCDGSHLEEFYCQLSRNPQEFKNDMKTDFSMNAKVYIQFSVALKKLFKE